MTIDPAPPVTVHTFPPPRPRSRIWLARVIAVIADAVQIVFIPLFAEGIASPVNDTLDVVVGLLMVWLVGWHIAFLPAFVVEALPLGDLAPSWTIAVFIATRGKQLDAGEAPTLPR